MHFFNNHTSIYYVLGKCIYFAAPNRGSACSVGAYGHLMSEEVKVERCCITYLVHPAWQ